jgi:hypothetical protein
MKKSKIFAAILFAALFSSLFLVANISRPTIIASGSAPVGSENPVMTPNWDPKPLGTNGTWIADITGGGGITLDGDLSDWTSESVPHDYMGAVDLYVAFDASYVYVAATWEDATLSDDISLWNKTGMLNSTHATWVEFGGSVDILTIGWSNSTGYVDTWTWTPSIITNDGYAYEGADAGTTSFIRNKDANGYPIYENDSSTLINQVTTPNGTFYEGWFDDSPTGSQNDVLFDWTWNASGNDMYVVEFQRNLDVGVTDDILFDFTDVTEYTIWTGASPNDAAIDLDVGLTAFPLWDDNEAATLTLNTVPGTVDESLLISGTVYDDYDNWELIVYMEAWDDTYFVGAYDYADVNLATGNWSYLFIYDQYDMPTGDQRVWVEFYPKYDAPIMLDANVTIEDNDAPQILGIVDLNERYPDGMPNDTDYVEVTVGLRDNYDATDDISANLYSYKDDGVALATPMVQFSSGGTTFVANISLDYDPAAENNYTYFIDAWDTSFNKVISEKYWFIYGYTEPVTTPGFGFIAAIVGLLGASFIVYKKFKK